ncbi:MAG TPA: TIGR00266 family protein [Chloroflexi bacterium]|nr:TIGR00266 family protein [Chloroflexota bacterium]
MKYRITGTTMQVLDILLFKGEEVFTEAGGMAWYRGQVQMNTNMPGGLMGGLGRALAGESLFLTTYTALSDQAEVTFAPEAPGAILPLELAAGQSVIAQRDAFMCAQQGVELAVHFKKRIGVGLFGGEGFILQRVSGPGMAFFEIDGEVRELELAAGEVIHVDPGHIALFEASVQHSIEAVKGVKNVLFGGEGLFLATLTGPGKVWLQTMPLSNLVAKIASRLPSK